ncbi:efflux RND transporter periplasmic adaptor subunit [Novosphingobium sp. 9]|uniref:efflux RND transporter periplasmic adaptor subunit n=1 Tax=Novosphingobium sp. 9 TaxID=2025349 RepID=UPI0021B57CDB|nr:efflux RND transporter periplasmic adaptor subunit [Novosphingobium sp. 9]
MHESTPQQDTARAPRGLKTAGIVAVLIAAGVVATGAVSRMNQHHAAQHWADARTVQSVHLVPVGANAKSHSLSLPGTMAAWNEAKLYARVNGYVGSWSKDIGANVAAGTALGTIDTPELDQQIAQARAQLAQANADAGLAKTTAARWNDLLSSNSVSRQEADEKNSDSAAKSAGVAAAKADLDRLLALKSYTVVRAPFAGVVSARNADIGDLVGPGASNPQPMFEVADLHKIRLYVGVPQDFSAAIHDGLTATLTTPSYPGLTFAAHVVGSAGVINTGNGTLNVQLLVDNPDGKLKPGGYAEVDFDLPGDVHTVTIPSSALIFRSAGTQVATVTPDHRIALHNVTLGRDMGSTVEVISGVSQGMQVVDNPADSITQGQQVQVENAHG